MLVAATVSSRNTSRSDTAKAVLTQMTALAAT